MDDIVLYVGDGEGYESNINIVVADEPKPRRITFPLRSLSSKLSRKRTKRDVDPNFPCFDLLPDELKLTVFFFLGFEHLCKIIPVVSKHWNELSHTHGLWRSLLQKHFPFCLDPGNDSLQNFKEEYRVLKHSIIVSATRKERSQKMKQDELVYIRIIILGDSYTGKTALIYQYVLQHFIGDDYMPTTCEDQYNALLNIQGKNVRLELSDVPSDTIGPEDSPVSWDSIDACILCFSLSSLSSSLDSVLTRWAPMVRRLNGHDIPLFLCGTMKDVRQNEDQKGLCMAHILGCPYLETSAKTGDGVIQAFEKVVLSIVPPPVHAQPHHDVYALFDHFPDEDEFSEEDIDDI